MRCVVLFEEGRDEEGRNEAVTSASGGFGGSRRSTDWHTRVVCAMDCSLCKRGTRLGTKTLKLSDSPCSCLYKPLTSAVAVSLYFSVPRSCGKP